jgi:hypothetical protein
MNQALTSFVVLLFGLVTPSAALTTLSQQAPTLPTPPGAGSTGQPANYIDTARQQWGARHQLSSGGLFDGTFSATRTQTYAISGPITLPPNGSFIGDYTHIIVIPAGIGRDEEKRGQIYFLDLFSV